MEIVHPRPVESRKPHITATMSVIFMADTEHFPVTVLSATHVMIPAVPSEGRVLRPAGSGDFPESQRKGARGRVQTA